MTITTELNIGDLVYFLNNNKIQKKKIERINVITDGNQKQVLYEITVKVEYAPTEDMGHIEDLENLPQTTEQKYWISSEYAYPSKDALLNSLMEESK